MTYIDKRYVATDRDGEVWIHACRPRRNEEKGLASLMFGFAMSLSDIITYEELRDETLANMLMFLEGTAHALGFDLLYHVRLKMKYNAIRPYKHGKAY